MTYWSCLSQRNCFPPHLIYEHLIWFISHIYNLSSVKLLRNPNESLALCLGFIRNEKKMKVECSVPFWMLISFSSVLRHIVCRGKTVHLIPETLLNQDGYICSRNQRAENSLFFCVLAVVRRGATGNEVVSLRSSLVKLPNWGTGERGLPLKTDF